MKLPKRLTSEPIVDALFEMRFTASKPVASILPGYLFAQLQADSIEQTPAGQLPETLRKSDPNLRAAATQKLSWGKFSVLVGDESLAVGCQLPYPGWDEFLPAIEKVFGLVAPLNVIELVNRHSIKYIDLLPATDQAGLEKLNITLTIGNRSVGRETYFIRTELIQDDYVHVVQSVNPAEILLVANNERRIGSILDIDSIKNYAAPMLYVDFLAGLNKAATDIHQANKELFFSCLAEQTVAELGAEYE